MSVDASVEDAVERIAPGNLDHHHDARLQETAPTKLVEREIGPVAPLRYRTRPVTAVVLLGCHNSPVAGGCGTAVYTLSENSIPSTQKEKTRTKRIFSKLFLNLMRVTLPTRSLLAAAHRAVQAPPRFQVQLNLAFASLGHSGRKVAHPLKQKLPEGSFCFIT